jgi:hypothetical protein
MVFHTHRNATDIRDLVAAYSHGVLVTVSPLLVRSGRTCDGCNANRGHN